MDIERGALKVTIEGSLMEVSDLRWSRGILLIPVERQAMITIHGEFVRGTESDMGIAAKFALRISRSRIEKEICYEHYCGG
jgi:hypothetical protein